MRSMKITLEDYVEHFGPPDANYIMVKRVYQKYDEVNGIYIPDEIKKNFARWIGIGEILAVSPHPCEVEYWEEKKELFRKSKYVGFSNHVVADVQILPQFEIIDDPSLVLLHVKDTTMLPSKLDLLLERYKKYEADKIREEEEAKKAIEERRKQNIEERESGPKTSLKKPYFEENNES